MRIGLDIDDTITRNCSFFAFLAQMAKEAGHEVHVITHRHDAEEAARELERSGIAYDSLTCLDPETIDDDDFYAWKGRICAEPGVDVMVDDAPEVLNHMPDGVMSLLVVHPDRGLAYDD